MAQPPVILVADDQAGQRTILEMLLARDGYRVLLAADGREALELLKTDTPDLAVLDINMPFASGIDICERMRRVSRLAKVPVIIMTALGDDATRARVETVKADALISKPFEGQAFRTAVRGLLERAAGEGSRSENAEG